MLPHIRIPLLAALLLGAAGTLAAQSTTLSPSPTLPSDTLEATERVDSFPTEPFLEDTTSGGADSPGQYQPDTSQTRGDSAALQELRSWIERHPGLLSPPPVRAVLVRV